MALVSSPYKSFLYNGTSSYYTLGSKYGTSEVDIVFYDDQNFRYDDTANTYSGKQAVEVQGYLYETFNNNATWKNNFYSIFQYVIPYYSSEGMVYRVSNYSSTLVKKIVLFKVPSSATGCQLYGVNTSSGSVRTVSPSITVDKTGYRLIGFYLTDETSGAFNGAWKYTEYTFRFKYPGDSDYEPKDCGYNRLDGYWYYNNFTVRYGSHLYLFGEISEVRVWEDIVSPNTVLNFNNSDIDRLQWCNINSLTELNPADVVRIKISDAKWHKNNDEQGDLVDIVSPAEGIEMQRDTIVRPSPFPWPEEMWKSSITLSSMDADGKNPVIIERISSSHRTRSATFKLYFYWVNNTRLNIYSNYYYQLSNEDGTVTSSGYVGGYIKVTVAKLQKYVG